MKIEKINDNQIRFILTVEDLAARQIRLSELAYGTEKARNLFQEMMEQAASECDFHADNIPLMIEAIPMRSGSIVLVVTKTENPGELDARFASFAPAVQNTGSAQEETASSALDRMVASICSDDAGRNSASPPTGQDAAAAQEALLCYRDFAIRNRIYLFGSMDQLLRGAEQTGEAFTGDSVLFRDGVVYGLLLKMKDVDEVNAMQQVLACLSEYGNPVPVTSARQQYLEEHGQILIGDHALEKLSGFHLFS